QSADLLDAIRRQLALTWLSAEEHTGAGSPDANCRDEVTTPPREKLKELLDLARMGKLVRVEQIALELEQKDARYGVFGRRLYGLARSFEEERLVAMLEDCVESGRDDTAG
ncbi:MAG TPA: hypothetical protein VF523_07635, partial [Burkholderiales bacterium]